MLYTGARRSPSSCDRRSVRRFLAFLRFVEWPMGGPEGRWILRDRGLSRAVVHPPGGRVASLWTPKRNLQSSSSFGQTPMVDFGCAALVSHVLSEKRPAPRVDVHRPVWRDNACAKQARHVPSWVGCNTSTNTLCFSRINRPSPTAQCPTNTWNREKIRSLSGRSIGGNIRASNLSGSPCLDRVNYTLIYPSFVNAKS